MYRIKDEYLDLWGAVRDESDIVSLEEIERLSEEWEKPVCDLLEQVEEC